MEERNIQPKKIPQKNTPTQGAVGGVSFVPKFKEKPSKIPNADEIKKELMRGGLSVTQKSDKTAPTVQKAKNQWNILRPLRTYKDDIAEALRKSGGSKISIKQKETERTKKRLTEDNKNLTEEARIQKEKKRVQDNLLQASSKFKKPFITRTKENPLKPIKKNPKYADIIPPKKKEGETKSAEQLLKQRREDETNLRPVEISNSHNKHSALKILLLSFFFIVVGSGVLYGAYIFLFSEKEKPPFLEISTLVFAEKNIDLSIKKLYGKDFQKAIINKKNKTSIPTDSITNLQLKVGESEDANLTVSDLLLRIGTHAPKSLSRSFSDKYMLGFYKKNRVEIFLILKPTFFENVFADMLVWEEYIAKDLSPLFISPLSRISIIKNKDDSPRISRSNFQDKIIENKDTRILYNSLGEIILLYSFVDKKTLIITTSKEALIEIFERMSAKRVSR